MVVALLSSYDVHEPDPAKWPLLHAKAARISLNYRDSQQAAAYLIQTCHDQRDHNVRLTA